MKMKIWAICLLAFFFSCHSAKAISPADYKDKFKVDMNDDIPPLEELRKMFISKPIYDRKFDYFWSIGTVFDPEFAQTIKEYGTRQSRLKWAGEDTLIEQIQALPQEYYQYIGPYLHTIPGISEKILNMPGIKETKNRFPERIAPHLKDIENIEFISPALYFLLNPDVWKKSNVSREVIRLQTIPQTNYYNTKFIKTVMEKVPPEDFAFGTEPREPVESRLRTISPDASSPLTSKDVQAFANTLVALKNYSSDIHNKAKIIEAGNLLDLWENSQGKGTILPNLKDLVHPCQRLVQKIKMQDMDKEFGSILAKEGFNLEEWGYTCDKTIKAYRVLKMTRPELLTLLLYKRNVYQTQLKHYSDKIAPSIAMTMQAIIEMYNATTEDMLVVKKNQQLLKKAFEDVNYRLVFQPIYIK